MNVFKMFQVFAWSRTSHEKWTCHYFFRLIININILGSRKSQASSLILRWQLFLSLCSLIIWLTVSFYDLACRSPITKIRKTSSLYIFLHALILFWLIWIKKIRLIEIRITILFVGCVKLNIWQCWSQRSIFCHNTF